MYVNKSQRVPLLHFSALCDVFQKKFQKFQVFSKKNVLRFLSLRYSADFGRSRLVEIYDAELLREVHGYTLRSYHKDLEMACFQEIWKKNN